MVRDNALAVSGLLSAKMYGPSTKPYQPEAIWDVVGLPGGDTRNYVQDTGENLYRRSLYNFWKRMAPPPNLEAFNAPSREVCTVRRERTNTPLQALVTLNEPEFLECARALARLALKDGGATDAERMAYAFRRCVARGPSAAEASTLLALLDKEAGRFSAPGSDPWALLSADPSAKPAPPAGVTPPRLAAWTAVARVLLNLDETITKE